MLGVEGLEDLVLQSAKLPLADMQKTMLEGVAAWRHGLLAYDVSLAIVEVRWRFQSSVTRVATIDYPVARSRRRTRYIHKLCRRDQIPLPARGKFKLQNVQMQVSASVCFEPCRDTCLHI
jgi:hypothetical protein